MKSRFSSAGERRRLQDYSRERQRNYYLRQLQRSGLVELLRVPQVVSERIAEYAVHMYCEPPSGFKEGMSLERFCQADSSEGCVGGFAWDEGMREEILKEVFAGEEWSAHLQPAVPALKMLEALQLFHDRVLRVADPSTIAVSVLEQVGHTCRGWDGMLMRNPKVVRLVTPLIAHCVSHSHPSAFAHFDALFKPLLLWAVDRLAEAHTEGRRVGFLAVVCHLSTQWFPAHMCAFLCARLTDAAFVMREKKKVAALGCIRTLVEQHGLMALPMENTVHATHECLRRSPGKHARTECVAILELAYWELGPKWRAFLIGPLNKHMHRSLDRLFDLVDRRVAALKKKKPKPEAPRPPTEEELLRADVRELVEEVRGMKEQIRALTALVAARS